MSLKENLKKEIEGLTIEELVRLSEHLDLIKKVRPPRTSPLPLEEIRRMTASSPGRWSDAVAEERRSDRR